VKPYVNERNMFSFWASICMASMDTDGLAF